MALTAYERETIVTLNDEDDDVRVWTAQRAQITRLRRDDNYTEINHGLDDGTEWVEFTCPKSKFRFGSKRTVNLTDEQRAQRAERLAKARSARS